MVCISIGMDLGDILLHYSDVIIGAVASQITSLTIVYPTVYSGADQRKHQSSASLAIYAGNSPVTSEFPAQMASNAENVSIWWRHRVNSHDGVHFSSSIISSYVYHHKRRNWHML